jgi:hypothetical protein
MRRGLAALHFSLPLSIYILKFTRLKPTFSQCISALQLVFVKVLPWILLPSWLVSVHVLYGYRSTLLRARCVGSATYLFFLTNAADQQLRGGAADHPEIDDVEIPFLVRKQLLICH